MIKKEIAKHNATPMMGPFQAGSPSRSNSRITIRTANTMVV